MEYIYLLGITSLIILLYLLIKLWTKYSNANSKHIRPSVYYQKTMNGYITLINSLYHNTNKSDLLEHIEIIIKERSDGRYVGGYTQRSNAFDFVSFSLDSFYDLMRFEEKVEVNFILELDKNVNIKKLNNFFHNSLPPSIEDKNFLNYHEKGASYPYTNVLSVYQGVLNKYAVQIGFFEDSSSSYYLVLHSKEDENLIRKAIADIGFEYEVVPIKISNRKFESKRKVAFS